MTLDISEKDSPKSFEDLAARLPEGAQMALFLPCGHLSEYPAALHKFLPATPVFVDGCVACWQWWVLGLGKGTDIIVPYREIRDREAAYTLWAVFEERPQKIGDFEFKVAGSPDIWQEFVRKTLH